MKSIIQRLLLVNLMVLPFIGRSQSVVIDSLKQALSAHSARDTIKVDLLNDLAFEFLYVDLAIVEKYLEESQELSEALKYQKGKGRIRYLKGIAELYRSNDSRAFDYFKEAIIFYDSISYKGGISACYNALGAAYTYQSDYENALVYYEKSVVLNKEIDNKSGLSAAYNNIGNLYGDIGEPAKAITYYKDAASLYEELNDEGGLSSAYNNLGVIYEDQGNLPLALKYYNESVYIDEKLGDSLGLSESLNNLGVIYKNQGKLDKAMACYQRSLNIHKKFKNPRKISRLKNNIALILLRKKAYPEALSYLREALALSIDAKDSSHTATVLNNLGDIHLELKELSKSRSYYEESDRISQEVENKGSNCNANIGIATTYFEEKQYQKSLVYTMKAKEIAEELDLLIYQRDVHHLLFSIYEGTGEYEKALASHKVYKKLEDSLFNEENLEKMVQLEYEYMYKGELESANERELNLTKTVKSTSKDLEKSQRNSFMAVIIILIVSIISIGVIFYLKLRNIRAKHQNVIIEQKLLRSQMTPHFIFNSLSVLQGMILNKEEKSSVSYLSKFSKLLRTTLENSRHKLVTLSAELAAVENYIALQNFDTSHGYKFDLSLDSEINGSEIEIPPMLIQPFIENAIEHAFIPAQENCEVKVEINKDGNRLICKIIDNGIGIDSSKKNNAKGKSSLATTITSERLEMLSREFKMKGSVLIEDREKFGMKGTVVTLVVPFKDNRKA